MKCLLRTCLAVYSHPWIHISIFAVPRTSLSPVSRFYPSLAPSSVDYLSMNCLFCPFRLPPSVSVSLSHLLRPFPILWMAPTLDSSSYSSHQELPTHGVALSEVEAVLPISIQGSTAMLLQHQLGQKHPDYFRLLTRWFGSLRRRRFVPW